MRTPDKLIAKALTFAFLLVIAPIFAKAAIPDKILLEPMESKAVRPFDYDKLTHRMMQIQGKSALVYRNYDVLNYSVFMDWYPMLNTQETIPTKLKYFGSNTIKARIDSANVSEIVLDAASMSIDSVKYPGGILVYNHDEVKNELKISLPQGTKQGDTVTFSVFYSKVPDTTDKFRGIFVYPKGHFVGNGPLGPTDSVVVEERIAYTMSEPEDARYWMPCNDRPYDKAYSEIKVRVPEGFTVATNGLLKSKTSLPDKSIIFYSAESKPITTYLMAATASKYAEYSDWYHRVTSPTDSVEVKYYIWAKDYESEVTDGSEYNARNSFQYTVKMMELYSNYFGEYPYDKYGMVAIQPFNYGGMEHQTMTSIIRKWLRGDDHIGIAHELAHQWLGDKITCATWSDVWINEGGATWAEGIWERSYSVTEYQYRMMQKAYYYMFSADLKNVPIFGLNPDLIFSSPYYFLSYNKGGWVYHMLEMMIGEEKFKVAIQQLLKKFEFKSIETGDFATAMEENIQNPPVDLKTFFDQWVYKAGYPIYSLTSTVQKNSGQTFKVNVSVKQNQVGDKIPDVFVMPVELVFFKNKTEISRQQVINNQRIQSFEFDLSEQPDSIAVNDFKVLCMNVGSTIALSVAENSTGTASLSPNPVTLGAEAQLSFHSLSGLECEVSVFDAFGRNVKLVYSGTPGEGIFNLRIGTNDLSSGTYLVRITEGSSTETRKLVIIK